MGAVWLGEDKLAVRQVAVKELRAPSGVTDDERDVFRKRALQEARSAARLAHPNAVILHDIVPATPEDDAVYLVMEGARPPWRGRASPLWRQSWLSP